MILTAFAGPPRRETAAVSLGFRTRDQPDESPDAARPLVDKSDKESFWGVFSRFLSPPTRAKIAKSYDVVAPDDRMRFHLRLRDQARVSDAPRHVITRITRYFPDISYDFAKQIVARAREEGAALVRVFSSLSDAEEAVELFRRADPPIHCEIFDAKTEELVST